MISFEIQYKFQKYTVNVITILFKNIFSLDSHINWITKDGLGFKEWRKRCLIVHLANGVRVGEC